MVDDNVVGMLLAGHRGERTRAPENTLTAFENALRADVDMIETDIHMTRDGVPVLMHDSTVDRTTDGKGPIRGKTLEEFKALNANPPGEFESAPTLVEFLEFARKTPRLLFNLELKDYARNEGEQWAFALADTVIALVEEYGIRERCVLNSFEAKTLEYVDDRYAHRYKLHGFYPLHHMGVLTRDPLSYLDCVTVYAPSHKQTPPGGEVDSVDRVVAPPEYFQVLRERRVESWLGPQATTEQQVLAGYERGARLITSDDPGATMAILRRNGLHE